MGVIIPGDINYSTAAPATVKDTSYPKPDTGLDAESLSF